MRNLKRFLALALTMLMVVGSFSVMSASAAFDDVTNYQDQINLLTTLKIIAGKSDGTFGYGESVQRYQMALFVARMATGKVGDDYTNWGKSSNYTAFTDIKADHFFGSISYASDNGIILGYVDAKGNRDKFGPTDGITVQDIFTMVVRMLGYGNSAMDAKYPWSYINKAIELGLDKSLSAKYNNEDVATREQTAVVLYNALFAKKADGTTIGEKVFNLTSATLVITGTSRGNYYNSAVAKTDVNGQRYVAVNKLNSAGGIETIPTYYLPVSAFGLSDKDENLYVGYSYDVITRDNFASLIYVDQNTAKKVDQTVFMGYAGGASGTALTIDGKSYTAVSQYYSRLFNIQGTYTTGEREIIAYDVVGSAGTPSSSFSSYVMDINGNILDIYGNILLYFSPNGQGVYLYRLADGTFVTPDASIWARAALVNSTTKLGAVIITNTHTQVYNKNAFSDTVLFDDNNDGVYDRANYTYYSFGFISFNSDKYLTINGATIAGSTAYNASGLKYIDGDGKVLAVSDVFTAKDPQMSNGNYVLYSYNPFNATMTIKKIYDFTVGIITSLDAGYLADPTTGVTTREATIAFDQVYYNLTTGTMAGKVLHIGNACLPGATFANVSSVANFNSLQGKTVHYIVEGNDVLAIYRTANSGKYVVFDEIVGMSTQGYAQAYVYSSDSAARSIVTIASVDNVWYGSFVFNPGTIPLAAGNVYYATTDSLGLVNLTTVTSSSYGYIGTSVYATTADAEIMGFVNGISNMAAPNTFTIGTGTTVTGLPQYATSASTVFVVGDGAGNFLTYKGIPDNSATLTITAGSYILYVYDSNNILTFVYAKYGTMNGTWVSPSTKTIVYLDSDVQWSMTNQYTGSVGANVTYTYAGAVDFIHGGLITVKSNGIYRAIGGFYYVVDGYITGQAVVGGPDIVDGLLTNVDIYNVTTITGVGGVATTRTNLTGNYIYTLNGTEITDTSATDFTPANARATYAAMAQPMANVKAYYYVGGSFAVNSPATSVVIVHP